MWTSRVGDFILSNFSVSIEHLHKISSVWFVCHDDHRGELNLTLTEGEYLI